MSDVDEDVFHEKVESWLEESFNDVEHEPHLESGRNPDFMVRTPFDDYVIEVENDFEAVYKGVGQALGYAAETGATPIVVIPKGHVEQPEFDHLAVHVRIFTV